MAPVFLTLGDVVEIHTDQLERYGGSSGIRDIGLLESAVAMPAAGFSGAYLHADIFEMAAYLYHIVRNHPFVDGNKRTGAVTAIVFLELNGQELGSSERAFETFVRNVAEGKKEKHEVAVFLRTHCRSAQ
jgi:death-on-curing protein